MFQLKGTACVKAQRQKELQVFKTWVCDAGEASRSSSLKSYTNPDFINQKSIVFLMTADAS